MTQAAGKLNHRIRLESLETSQDADGETVETWTHQGDVWAEVAPISAKEFVSSAAMQSRIVARVTVRYRSDIQANWRLLFRDRYYNIEGVLTDVVSGLEYLTLPCSLGVSANTEYEAPWQIALRELRSFISSNYDQPNPHNQGVMSSPPTITTLAGATPPAGLSVGHQYQNADPALSYFGGGDKALSTIFRQFPVATIGTTGGNIGDGQNAVAWRVGAVVDAQRVSFRVRGQGTLGYRFIVDGQYASLSYTATASSSGSNFITLDFGVKASRTVQIESEAALAFVGIYIAVGDSISAMPAPKRIIVLTDSFGEASILDRKGDCLVYVAGDMLGFSDAWSSGTAGTGYLADATTKLKLLDRIDDCNAHGPWDVIVVAMGINDTGFGPSSVKAEAELCYASLRASNPSAQIYALGPWDNWAPGVPGSAWQATHDAIESAVSSVPSLGVTFIDTQGVVYDKYDGTHPSLAGHKTLGDWLALKIKNIVVA